MNRPVVLESPPMGCRCLVCLDEPETWDEREQRTAKHVREIGWSVFGIIEEDGDPGWAFTIGLRHNYDLPELVMFGRDVPDMQNWLNRVVARYAEGQPITAGEVIDGIVGVQPVMLTPVDPSWQLDFLGAAVDFYRGSQFDVLQLIWPDDNGTWPWEEGAHGSSRQRQPKAWVPLHEHTGGVWQRIAATSGPCTCGQC